MSRWDTLDKFTDRAMGIVAVIFVFAISLLLLALGIFAMSSVLHHVAC